MSKRRYHTPASPKQKNVSQNVEMELLGRLGNVPMLTPALEAEIDEQAGMAPHGAVFGSAFDPNFDGRFEDFSDLDEPTFSHPTLEPPPENWELTNCEDELDAMEAA